MLQVCFNDLQAALDKANKALGTDMQKIVQQLGELQKIFTQNKKELDMQRKVSREQAAALS